MKKLFLIALLFCASLFAQASPAWGAIAFVNTGVATATSGSTITITYTSTAGNMMVITYITKTTFTALISSISDSTGGSITWTKANAINGGNGRTEVWTSSLGAASVTSITLHLAAAVTDAVTHVAEYSGVQGIGTNTTNSASTNNPTISLTTQDNNNFVVSGLGENAATAFVAQTGNLRAQQAGVACLDGVVDNTSASPASVTTSVTFANPAHSWQAVAVELRTTNASNAVPAINKRIKLEQLDNLTAVLTGGGLQATANEPGLATGPCDPADLTCVEYLNVCFADGTCHPILVGDKPAAVSIVKTWSPGGVLQITTTPILSVIALPNSAVP